MAHIWYKSGTHGLDCLGRSTTLGHVTPMAENPEEGLQMFPLKPTFDRLEAVEAPIHPIPQGPSTVSCRELPLKSYFLTHSDLVFTSVIQLRVPTFLVHLCMGRLIQISLPLWLASLNLRPEEPCLHIPLKRYHNPATAQASFPFCLLSR